MARKTFSDTKTTLYSRAAPESTNVISMDFSKLELFFKTFPDLHPNRSCYFAWSLGTSLSAQKTFTGCYNDHSGRLGSNFGRRGGRRGQGGSRGSRGPGIPNWWQGPKLIQNHQNQWFQFANFIWTVLRDYLES